MTSNYEEETTNFVDDREGPATPSRLRFNNIPLPLFSACCLQHLDCVLLYSELETLATGP